VLRLGNHADADARIRTRLFKASLRKLGLAA
jgi:hypothetical protein